MALIENGSNINLEALNGVTPLVAAIIGGHEATGRLLLKKGASAKQIYRDIGVSDLAARAGMNALARLMQETNQSEHVDDIYVAAHRGDVPRISQIITSDSSAVVKPDSNGWLPLFYAIKSSKEGAVNMIWSGSPTNMKRRMASFVADDKSTALGLAASSGDESLVDDLIKFGAAIDSDLGRGVTAASLAARNGHKSLASKLSARLKDQVITLQQYLTISGYPVGAPDGEMGPATRKALSKASEKYPSLAGLSIEEVSSALRRSTSAGLYVCNFSDHNEIFAARAAITMDGNGMLSGWWKVLKNQCEYSIKANRDTKRYLVFATADGQRQKWMRTQPSNTARQCAPNSVFEKKLGSSCDVMEPYIEIASDSGMSDYRSILQLEVGGGWRWHNL